MDKRFSKLILIFVFIILAIFGILFQVLKKDENKEGTTKETVNEIKEEQGELPEIKSEDNNPDIVITTDPNDMVEDTDPETINENSPYDIKIYFTNMDEIDERDLIPVQAHGFITEKTQRYLNDNGYEKATELRVIDDSIVNNDEYVEFRVSMEEYPDVELVITWDLINHKFSFGERKEYTN